MTGPHRFAWMNLAAAVCLATVACLAAGPAAEAQTATNLKCKGCVGKKDLGKNSVSADNIRANAVGTAKIAPKAVTAGKIAPDAVLTKHIRDGAVSAAKIAAGAVPTAAASIDKDYGFGVTVTSSSNSTPTEVLKDTVTVPADGNLHVSANWVADLPAGATGFCWVTYNYPHYTSEYSIRMTNPASGYLFVPGSVVALFRNVPAGQHVIRLLCRKGSTDFDVLDSSLVSLFVPGSM